MKVVIFFLSSCTLLCSSMPARADAITEQPGYVRSELIFPLDDKPTPSCHASTLVETAEGVLVAAWFGGTHERNDDVGIWVSRFEGGAWTRPVEVADGVMSTQRRYPCWNPVLFRPNQGPLVLFFKVGPTPSEWWGERVISTDETTIYSVNGFKGYLFLTVFPLREDPRAPVRYRVQVRVVEVYTGE